MTVRGLKPIFFVALTASLFCIAQDNAVAKEWSTPEALKAFGKPGDTVRGPALEDANMETLSKNEKSKKQISIKTEKESTPTNETRPAVTKKLDTGLEDFKNELVSAYSHPDKTSIRALTHPKSLACLRTEPKYEQYLLRAETMEAIPPDAIISVDTVAANTVLPYRGFKFPMRPSHMIRIEFGGKVSPDGSKISQVASKYIARIHDRWYLILPCPTTEGMTRLREMGLLD